jgi:hypothetical protein
MTTIFVSLVAIMALQAQTAVVLGVAERDLTGDGKPEILRLVGTGPAIDDLAVTFTIESAGRTIYRYELEPLTRTVGFGAGRQVISAEQHRARIKEFGPWFFAEEKFQRPDEYVATLRVQAPGRLAEAPEVVARDRQGSDTRSGGDIWQEIQDASVTIFTFSPGGDAIVAIGWSAKAGRFYRLLECC